MSAENLLVESYINWIRETTSAELLDEDVIELTTPFVDRHNDHLQIYAEQKDADVFLLTDDGYIIAELKSSGVERRGRRRAVLLEQLLSGYGVTLKESELQVLATREDLGARLHNLVQAMLSVDDMFMLSNTTVGDIFMEDVTKFFDTHRVRYTARAKFAGKSGLDHLVDFVIPRSHDAPERIVQVVNSPRRDRIENMLFAINDIRETRAPDTAYYALLNDTKRAIPGEVRSAFREYSVEARPWSQREEIVDSLAA